MYDVWQAANRGKSAVSKCLQVECHPLKLQDLFLAQLLVEQMKQQLNIELSNVLVSHCLQSCEL